MGFAAANAAFKTINVGPAPRGWGFPGQSSQRVGMGAKLYEASPVYRDHFDRAHQSLLDNAGVDLKTLVFEGPTEDLTRTLHAQPALLVSNVAFLETLKADDGLAPAANDWMAGHSLGEWTAYVAAGALSIEAGALAVYWRGRFMEEAFPFDPDKRPMAAVIGLPSNVIEEVCQDISREGHIVVPANYNCPGQLVISGHPAAVKEASDELLKKGAKGVKPLEVAAPFHSPLMAEVRDKLADKLSELGIAIGTPKQRIISNFTGQAIEPNGDHLDSLLNQITGAVRWHDSMLEAWRLGVRQFVSVDVSGQVLVGFASKIFSRAQPMQIVDLRLPMQRHALRVPIGVVKTTSYPPDAKVATERLLRYSYNAAAVAKTVKALVEAGEVETALIVLRNEYYKARDAGLRQLAAVQDDPRVVQAMADYQLEWPAPEVRDLATTPLPAAEEQQLTTILTALQAYGMAPINPADLAYFVASRWEGEAKKLGDLIKAIERILDMAKNSPGRLQLLPYKVAGERQQGVMTWEELVLYGDSKVKFSHPGAFNQEDLI